MRVFEEGVRVRVRGNVRGHEGHACVVFAMLCSALFYDLEHEGGVIPEMKRNRTWGPKQRSHNIQRFEVSVHDSLQVK